MIATKSLFRAALLATVPIMFLGACRSTGTPTPGPLVAHDVYFDLVDDSPEACTRLAEACHVLGDLPGVVFLAAGTRDATRSGEVNDVDYDVALHVYFESHAAYDAYLPAPEHLSFVEEHKGNWARVRVFDSNVVSRR